MRKRTFIYGALVFTAFAIFLGWIGPISARFGTYTLGFWGGVIPLLGMLLIILGPVGNALVPDKDDRGAVLGRLAAPYLIYLVLYTLGRAYIVASGPLAWLMTIILYVLAIISLWFIERRHEQ